MDVTSTATWIEVCLDRYGPEIRITARGSRGEQTAPRVLSEGHSVPRMLDFADIVRRAAMAGNVLGADRRREAEALGSALFDGQIEAIATGLRSAGQGKLLVRLLIFDPELQAVPWEAACKFEEALGFWAVASDLLPVRGVTSTEPWLPAPIEGAVRVQAIAPSSSENLASLSAALQPRIEAKEIEWLEPITGLDARPEYLFPRLRNGPIPHILHFIGHGGLQRGVPVLRVDDGSDEDEEQWIAVDALAQQLRAICGHSLQLIILESCEGARPTTFASAAEILARAGAGAVIAHLWPVRAAVAKAFSMAVYRSLTARHVDAGNIAVAVNEGRRTILTMLEGSAAAFSPVVYLRDTDGLIFDFSKRPNTIEEKPVITTNKTSHDDGPRIQLWRKTRIQDELRFDPPEDGFDDGDNSARNFPLGPSPLAVFLGRAADLKGHKNDLVLPYKKVSQQCLRIIVEDRQTTLERLEQCRALVTIDTESLEVGEKRRIHHGQRITIGQVVSGVFVDGRFTQPLVPKETIDPVTGLLGRHGMSWEMAIAARLAQPMRVILVRPFVDADRIDEAAARIAFALHGQLPSQPVGRLKTCAAILLDTTSTTIESLIHIARRATDAAFSIGVSDPTTMTSLTTLSNASAWIDDACASLMKVQPSGASPTVIDLSEALNLRGLR